MPDIFYLALNLGWKIGKELLTLTLITYCLGSLLLQIMCVALGLNVGLFLAKKKWLTLS